MANEPKEPKKVEGRKLAVGFLAVLLGFAALIFVIGVTGGSQHVPRSAPGVGFNTPPTGSGQGGPQATGGRPQATGPVDAGPPTRTIQDRRVRDELRQRILAAWAQGEGSAAESARQGRFEPAPKGEGGGSMDPKYIQSVVRSDLFPMAVKCYEELLSRKKDADVAGRVVIDFTIAGDEKIGGFVEDAKVQTDGGLADERLVTCMRESFMSLAFRPPEGGGVVTVTYPIELAPDDPDGG